MRRYLLTGATLFFIFGILLGWYFHWPFKWTAGMAAILLTTAIYFRRRNGAFIAGVLAALLCLGAAYEKSFYVAQRGTLPRSYSFKDKVTAMEGVVASEISEKRSSGRPKRSFAFAVERVCVNGRWEKTRGRTLAYVFRRDVTLEYGERIRVTGKLHRPFSGSGRGRSSYREYLDRQGIFWALSISKNSRIEVLARQQGNPAFSWILSFRERLRQILWQYLNRREAAIMETMLLGTTNDAPQYIQNFFRTTGTTHILAISGLHVTMMATLFFILLKVLPIGRRGQYALTILLLLGYTLLTGSRPSALRAFLMSGVFLASALFERESDSLNSLSLSALVILVINPFYIFDIGFQLSYICVLGIILVYPLFWKMCLDRWAITNGFWRVQVQSLLLSLAVWIAVAGMIAYYFSIISPVTILANLVVVPLSSLVLFLGTGFLLTGLFSTFWALLFAGCLKVALSILVFCVYIFAKIPYGYFWIKDIPLTAIFVYYAALILGFVFLRRLVGPVEHLTLEESYDENIVDTLGLR